MRTDDNSDRRLIARSYLRVSYDSSGRMRSTAEQEHDNEVLADELGWQLVESYTECDEDGNDRAVSASRYGRKARDGFARLVADLEAGRFGADVLVLWESSRGSRRLSEWARFLELLEDRGVRLYVTSHERLYDLSNYRDRKSMQEDGMSAEYEAAQTSARVRRASAASARDGRPSGGRAPYGYRRTYDEATGRLTGQRVEPGEAENVADMFAMFTAGESLRAIAAAMRERGVVGPGRKVRDETVAGNPASIQFVRQVLLNPAYYGARAHNGNIAVEDAWPAIVTKGEWLAVKAVFDARATGPRQQPGRARHLCSALAPHVVCGVCDATLGIQRIRGKMRYRCKTRDGISGHVTIACDELDSHVSDVVVDYLTRPDQVAELVADDEDDERLEAARTMLAEVKAEHADLAAQVASGALSATLAAAAEPGIFERLKAAQHQVDELTAPPRLRGLIEPGADVAQHWEAAPITAKRDVLRALLTPGVLGQVRVNRRPAHIRGSMRCPVKERVEWR